MIADNRDRSTNAPSREQATTPQMPAAGPHARSDLTDPDKTPGSGMFPTKDDTNPSPTG
jgi:hypothetical protein